MCTQSRRQNFCNHPSQGSDGHFYGEILIKKTVMCDEGHKKKRTCRQDGDPEKFHKICPECRYEGILKAKK